jgi:hypothetical protein
MSFQAVSGQNRHFLSKLISPGQYESNHVDQGKKWVFRPFRVKTVIFDQNQVHRVNSGPIMSTEIKNEFQAILGQNCYFWSKPGLPVWYPSKVVFFLVSQHNFQSLKLIFSGWIGLFLILIWVFNFTYINIYYYI